MQRRNALAVLGAAAIGSPVIAEAHNFPSSPVKIIVPYAAGGGADAVARLLAQGMARELHQSLIVDNRAGAGGMLGAEVAAKATPDGYTVLFAGNPELTIAPALYPKIAYAPLADFLPMVLVSQSPNVLVCSASLGVKTLPAALDAARKRPGGITIGTPGNGTPMHVAVELLRSHTGLDIIHVPYKGAGPATVAALGGEVSFALVGAPPLLPQLATGKLIALAVTQPERSPLLPQIPTIGQAMGFMNEVDLVAWYGLLVPAHTPGEIVAQLENAALIYLEKSDTRSRFRTLGTDLLATPAAEFATRLRRETKQYEEIIQRFGIKAG